MVAVFNHTLNLESYELYTNCGNIELFLCARGAVKLHLPVEVFVQCSQATRGENTLFPDVCSFNITYADMQAYLPLILGIYEISPEGDLVPFIKIWEYVDGLWLPCYNFILHCMGFIEPCC